MAKDLPETKKGVKVKNSQEAKHTDHIKENGWIDGLRLSKYKCIFYDFLDSQAHRQMWAKV